MKQSDQNRPAAEPAETSPLTVESPAAEAPLPEEEDALARKVGLPRFFELLGRDLWSFYRASLLCVLGFLPGTVGVAFFLLAEAPLWCVVCGVAGGMLGAPFLCGLIDTVLRALRDEPGYWWHTYKRAWRQNWRQSLVPGAMLGLFLGGWLWMLRTQLAAGNASIPMWVGTLVSIFVCTGVLAYLFAQVPLVDLPLTELLKNAGLMFLGFFPRTLAAALVLCVYWGLVLLYLPYTIPVLLVFGFWLPVVIVLMVLYPGLNKAFKLEETLHARRDAEIRERIDQNQPTFTSQD